MSLLGAHHFDGNGALELRFHRLEARSVPRIGTSLDLASIASCVAKLKAADPAYASEDQATIAANSLTPLREVMDVALTLQPKFPKIMFGIAR